MPGGLPAFYGLESAKPVYFYQRDLPHVRQEGATYFATFRLADSIPASKIRQWRHERRIWCCAHGLTKDLTADQWQETYQAIPDVERQEFEHRVARQLFVELDACHGSCLLKDMRNTAIVSDALKYFDGKRYRCGDFCVMPNHVHWLVLPLPGYELEDILGSIKGYTSKQINAHMKQTGQLWQRESYDGLVRDASELLRTREYIANNPAKAKLSPEERIWRCQWLDSVQSIQLDG